MPHPNTPFRFALAALAPILLLGLAVRGAGIRHGEPDKLYHPDVGKIAQVAWKTYAGKTADLQGAGGDFRFKAYPYGHGVMTGAALRAFDRMTGRTRMPFRSDSPQGLWYWSYLLRWSATLTWLFTAVLLLLALRPILSPVAFVLTGLLLVLEPFNAQYSHYGMNDVSMTAALLVTWACVPGTLRPGIRGLGWTAAAGLAIGAGFAIKYQAILGGLMLVPAWIAGLRAGRWRTVSGNAAVFALTCLLAAGLLCPLLRTPGPFWEMFLPFMEWQSRIASVTRDGGPDWASTSQPRRAC